MTVRLAINGFGRIGCNILRALYENASDRDLKVVAVNDPGELETGAFLLQHDTVHGRFNGDVKTENGHMVVNGDKIRWTCELDPAKLPWDELGVDIVLECTGKFTSKAKAKGHLDAGAKKVIISAPGGDDVDATVVYGINHDVIKADHTVISNASCTTNCLVPLVKPLHDQIGIESGLMNTVHAYTNDQKLIDVHHKDIRRARSATHSLIPTKTGAAASVGKVLPELDGKLDGFATRAPVINVSLVDLTFQAQKRVTAEQVNEVLKQAAQNELAPIVDYNESPFVSIDFNHHPASSVFDLTQTKVCGNVVKVVAWYDNEWGFSNRMIDTAETFAHIGG